MSISFPNCETSHEAPLPGNRLAAIPSLLASACIGVYLPDAEAAKWARCSHRSLAQLQLYVFKGTAAVSLMLRLSTPMRRPAAAFGRVLHVQIASASEWTESLPRLPPSVRRVTIQIPISQSVQLNTRNPTTKISLAAGGDGSQSPFVVHLPSTVCELYFHAEAAQWSFHLRIASDSCLQVLHLPTSVSCWTSLPRFIRDSLPDTVLDLGLPRFFGSDVEPSAENYPAHWPPNLTRLSIASSVGSALAAGNLPPFPLTLTSIDSMMVNDSIDVKNIPHMLRSFPSSITALELFSTESESMNGNWKLPEGLLSLRLPSLKAIYLEPLRFSFPPVLRELHLPSLSEPARLNGLLPATLTTLTLHVSPSVKHPFGDMQWPSNLSTLSFAGDNSIGSLRGWVPPPHLTKLNLGRWNTPLDGVAFPSTLRTLVVRDHSHSLADVLFPPNLENIEFNGRYEAPALSVDAWNPPPHLQSLSLGKWDHNLYLPRTLTRFVAGRYFNPASFKSFGETLPRSLRELDLRHSLCCRHPLDTLLLPPNLRILRICSNPSFLGEFSVDRLPVAAQLPASLLMLHLYDDFNINRSRILEWAATNLPVQCALQFD